MSLGQTIAALGFVMELEPKHVHGASYRRTPLYLFACHLEWCNKGKLEAYQELVAALDDGNEEIRTVAERLLHRSSPRRRLEHMAASGER